MSSQRSHSEEDDLEVPSPSNASSGANREKATAFIRYALTDLEEAFLVLSFLPLLSDMRFESPERLLAPAAGINLLDVQRWRNLLTPGTVIVGVLVMADDQYMKAAGRILRQLSSLQCTCFVATLLPSNLQVGVDFSADQVVLQGKQLVEMGAADTILDPGMSSGSLQHTVHMMRIIHRQQMQYVAMDVEHEAPLYKDEEEIRELERHRHKLLWQDIPHYLMPNLPRTRRKIDEDATHVGQYLFESTCECHVGTVLIAKVANRTDRRVAIKVVKKSEVHTPNEIENIYREYRYLQTLKHPNMVKCEDFLNTPRSWYLILGFSGSENLEQYCQRQPRMHLCEEEAMLCFKQIADALGYMHQEKVVHRLVSPHHVMVQRLQHNGDDTLHCHLADFRHAIAHQEGYVSALPCGTFPCMAPEMMSEEGYVALFVDSWSLGILLLEIAGGLKSLEACAKVAFDHQDELSCVRAIEDLFRCPGCHGRALASKDGVQSPQIVAHLIELLQLRPESRMSPPALAALFK